MHWRALLVAGWAVILPISSASAIDHTKDSLDKVRQNLSSQKAVLIDVREKSEWDRGHLKDAQLVPLSELRQAAKNPPAMEQLQKKLPKDKIVYCHCAKGVRALTAGSLLEKLGYDVRPLALGFDDLSAAGLNVAEK